MESNVIDLQTARAAREAKREVAAEKRRPYASMEDLPDVTIEGQLAVQECVYEDPR